MIDQATKEPEFPTIESQEAYWRTKEADLSLDKVESGTDYYDHFLVGNPTSEIPFHSNETERCLHLNCPKCHGTGIIQHGHNRGETCVHMISCRCRRCSPGRCLSLEDRKTPSASTLAEEKTSVWKEPEWTLRDEVGESYREIP